MGMPSEGLLANATIKRLISEVPQCRLEDDTTSLKSRVANGWDICVVVDSERIVLGLLELSMIPNAGTLEDIMKRAPLTLRAS